MNSGWYLGKVTCPESRLFGQLDKFGFADQQVRMRRVAKSSLEDIAKQAAVSRPLIYRKFKSKEEIFGAVLEDLLFRDLSTARQQLSVQYGERFKQVSSHISAKSNVETAQAENISQFSVCAYSQQTQR